MSPQEPLEDKSGSAYSPLHWAALRGFTEMAQLLIRRKANVELCDKHNNTPLMLAEKKGNKEIIQLLNALKRGEREWEGSGE